jgi:integrase
MKLNDRNVSASKPELQPGETDVIFFDDDMPGFGLRVRASGSRTWVFQYSRNGRARKMTLGKYPGMTAQAAREIVAPLYHQVGLGRDPASEKQQAQVDHDSFGDVVALYLAAKRADIQKDDYRERTYVETARYLNKYARSLHTTQLAKVTRRDIADLLSKVVRDHGSAAANRTRSNLSALFTWAIKEGKAEANAVLGTAKREEKSRDRVLTDAELAAIWNALPDGDYSRIVRLLMLTGQRREEIGGLRWSEIAGDTINLPPNRTKNGLAHFVPLAAPARDILTTQPRGERDHVFGRGDGEGGFAGWSAAKASLDTQLADREFIYPNRRDIPEKMRPWTLHDLRRTCATGMAELGVQPHIVELVLNHISGHKGGIAGVYNRAVNGKERREALELWAKHVSALVGEGKKSGPFAVIADALPAAA